MLAYTTHWPTCSGRCSDCSSSSSGSGGLIVIFGDIFRSQDMGGWAKALWVIFVIVSLFPASSST